MRGAREGAPLKARGGGALGIAPRGARAGSPDVAAPHQGARDRGRLGGERPRAPPESACRRGAPLLRLGYSRGLRDPSPQPRALPAQLPREAPLPAAARSRRARSPARPHSRRRLPRASGATTHSPSAWCRGCPGCARARGGQGGLWRRAAGEPRCPRPHTRAPRPASGLRPPRGRGTGRGDLPAPGPSRMGASPPPQAASPLLSRPRGEPDPGARGRPQL